MIDRTTRLRWRRIFRRRRRIVEDVGIQAEQGLEKHFFKRLSSLAHVKRFVISWLLLVGFMIGGSVIQFRSLTDYYQETVPAPGGTFTEGQVGVFTNANPIYATSAVDSAVSRLVFSSLMRYNEQNRLVGDLAQSIDQDATGRRYVVTLRDNLRWHDGRPLTAQDVVFTFHTIQNPDARSHLLTTWRGIRVSAHGDRTIIFVLPNALGSFPHVLTTGILPQHVVGRTSAARLRTARFNTMQPVGSGPFKWGSVEVAGTSQENREERIGLNANEYFYRNAPRLQRFIVRTFRSESQMATAYSSGQLNAMAGLSDIPGDIIRDRINHDYRISLQGEVMVFFNTKQEPLRSVTVRRALVRAVDVPQALGELNYPVIAARGPLLVSQPGYNSGLTQFGFDQLEAQRLLESAGWRVGPGGIRTRNGRPLTFTLFVQNTNDYVRISRYLREAWKAVGVDAKILLQSDVDIQASLRLHDYQAIMYGISLGPDPDVFPYWHSSQAAPQSPNRLNLSEYDSAIADEALASGRTRAGLQLRIAKYHAFQEAWRMDAPALALYQPQFIYVTRGELYNFKSKLLNTATDRYANVENWMIRQDKITR